MKSQLDSIIICFSLKMCCCCLVSTICAFFMTFKAKLFVWSVARVTSSTRPKPPTPKVATFLRSGRVILENCSLSLFWEGIQFNRNYIKIGIKVKERSKRFESIPRHKSLFFEKSIKRKFKF